jgi:hypothetical protein
MYRSLAIGLHLVLLGFAWIAAPHSCEWGLAAYTGAGVSAVLVGIAGNFVLQANEPFVQRAVRSGLTTFTLITVWLTGFFAADFRLLCRLF